MKLDHPRTRRPVIAIVVKPGNRHRRASGDPFAQCPGYLAQRERRDHGHDRVRGRQRAAGARLHHHANRTCDFGGRRHRLHRVKARRELIRANLRRPGIRFARFRRSARKSTRCLLRVMLPEAEVPILHRVGRESVRLAYRLPNSSSRTRSPTTSFGLFSPAFQRFEEVQKAEILGAHVRDADLARPKQARGPRGHAHRRPACARRKQLPCRRTDQGFADSSEPDDEHRSRVSGGVQEARDPRKGRSHHPDRGRWYPLALWGESYDERVNFTGRRRSSSAPSCFRTPMRSTSFATVRKELEAIKKDLPSQLTATVAYDATAYIEDAIKEVVTRRSRRRSSSSWWSSSSLGSFRSVLVPVVAIPVSLIGAVFLDAALRVHTEPPHLARRRFVRRARGRRRDRHRRKRRTAPSRGPLEDRGRNRRCQAARHADHRDDHHVGGRVYADCVSGGAHGSLFREFALTLAGAVMISGIVALTLSPLMSARFLNEHKSDRGLSARIDRGFQRLRTTYSRHLAFALEATEPASTSFGSARARSDW